MSKRGSLDGQSQKRDSYLSFPEINQAKWIFPKTEDDFSFIREALDVPSHRNVIKNTAEQIIKDWEE